jgi:hypothetical protein
MKAMTGLVLYQGTLEETFAAILYSTCTTSPAFNQDIVFPDRNVAQCATSIDQESPVAFINGDTKSQAHISKSILDLDASNIGIPIYILIEFIDFEILVMPVNQ